MLRRRRMSAAINCCAYLLQQTLFAAWNSSIQKNLSHHGISKQARLNEEMKRNFGKETKPSLGTVFNIAEVKLRRRRMSAAINCCSYLSFQTSLAEPNKYIKQSGHEVNSPRQPVPSTKQFQRSSCWIFRVQTIHRRRSSQTDDQSNTMVIRNRRKWIFTSVRDFFHKSREEEKEGASFDIFCCSFISPNSLLACSIYFTWYRTQAIDERNLEMQKEKNKK